MTDHETLREAHTATCEIDDGYSPRWSFECHAPEGAPCRMVCDTCDGPCDPDNDCTYHDMGECNMIAWLENDDATNECLDGSVSWSGPVELRWNDEGEGVRFSPVEAEVARLSEGEPLEWTVEGMSWSPDVNRYVGTIRSADRQYRGVADS